MPALAKKASSFREDGEHPAYDDMQVCRDANCSPPEQEPILRKIVVYIFYKSNIDILTPKAKLINHLLPVPLSPRKNNEKTFFFLQILVFFVKYSDCFNTLILS